MRIRVKIPSDTPFVLFLSTTTLSLNSNTFCLKIYLKSSEKNLRRFLLYLLSFINFRRGKSDSWLDKVYFHSVNKNQDLTSPSFSFVDLGKKQLKKPHWKDHFRESFPKSSCFLSNCRITINFSSCTLFINY